VRIVKEVAPYPRHTPAHPHACLSSQDVDGSHIKGLIINLLHTLWPELLQQPAAGSDATAVLAPPFIEQFVTPVIKARRGTALREFFSVRQFEQWQAEGRRWLLEKKLGDAAAGREVSSSSSSSSSRADEPLIGEAARGKWTVKYYKGLGTSTAAEGRGYFGALEKHRKPFVWSGPADGDRIAMAFSKDRADDRKAWIGAQSADDAIIAAESATRAAAAAGTDGSASPSLQEYHELPAVTFSDFIDRELIDFSRAVRVVSCICIKSPLLDKHYVYATSDASMLHSIVFFASFVLLQDLVRSIPSVLDGLKPSQRKVIFACFKREGAAAHKAADALRSASPSHADDATGAAASDGDAGVDALSSSHSASEGAAAAAPTTRNVSNPPTALPAGGSEVKVAQLAGYVSEHTAYHHGEASLVSTIVGMAQDFPGSNNVPLLQPLGQFGTRLQVRCSHAPQSVAPLHICTSARS
jgi:hypothetical protein